MELIVKVLEDKDSHEVILGLFFAILAIKWPGMFGWFDFSSLKEGNREYRDREKRFTRITGMIIGIMCMLYLAYRVYTVSQ